jgi:hypothetical protein
MTTIISGGCSMIWGSELSDHQASAFSQKTWPALCARNLGLPYHSVAVPGGSNATIARQIIHCIEKSQRSDWFVIVQWTFPSRQEFRFNQAIPRNNDENYFSISPWTVTNNPERDKILNADPHDDRLRDMRLSHDAWAKTGVLDFSDQYYKSVSTEQTDVYLMIKEIAHLKWYLESKQIPWAFGMAASQPLKKYFTGSCDDRYINAYIGLIKDIEWLWFGQSQGFYEWAVDTQQPMGVAFHPLDQAHALAYEQIKDQLNEMVKKTALHSKISL